jgi:membrane protein implicated in regulation of membrane protease activity
MTFELSAWWEALTLIQKIFWVIAGPSTLLLIIQLILTFVGGEIDDIDIDSDIDFETDHGGIGYQFLTFKNVLGFFTMFGWIGLACLDFGFGIFISVVVAFIAGLIMMALMAFLFYQMSKLQQSGSMRIESAIDQTGEVYLTIPKNRDGVGKINITLNGTLREMDAVTDDPEPLKNGSIVQVLDIVSGNLLLVTKRLF